MDSNRTSADTAQKRLARQETLRPSKAILSAVIQVRATPSWGQGGAENLLDRVSEEMLDERAGVLAT
jgi:hypothetical protein